MSGGFSVRQYCADDATQVERLYAAVTNPYRPEDADQVLPMEQRALSARAAGEGWSPLVADESYVGEQAHLAFWVAVALDGTHEEVVGTLGLRRVGDEQTVRNGTAERSGLPAINDWIASSAVMSARSVDSA